MTRATHPPRERPRGKWGLYGLVAALLMLAVFAACEASGWRFLKQPLERFFSQRLAQPVALAADFRLYLLGGIEVQVAGLKVGSPQWLNASGLKIEMSWLDAIRALSTQELVLQAVQADDVAAQLTRYGPGKVSWPQPAAKTQPSNGSFQLQSVQLRKGLLRYLDEAQGTRLTLHLTGGEGADSSSALGYVATLNGTWQNKRVDLQAQAPRLLPLLRPHGNGHPPDMVAVRVSGQVGATRLSFEGETAALLATAELNGKLFIAGASLADVGAALGLTLPQTGQFELSGLLEHRPDEWVMTAHKIEVGSSRLSGKFNYLQGQGRPLLTGQLRGSRLALADLRPAISGSGPRALPAKASGVSVQDRRLIPSASFDLPSLRVMDVDVQVFIDKLLLGSDEVRPLNALRTQLSLSNGRLSLNALSATVAGGHVTGKTSLDSNIKPAQWRAQMNLEGVELSDWFPSLKNAPAVAPAQTAQSSTARAAASGQTPTPQAAAASSSTRSVPYATGRLNVALDAQGSGNSTAQILGSLDGSLRARVLNGQLSHLLTELMGLDLAQALGLWISGDQTLALNCANMTLLIDDGVASTQNFLIDNSDSRIKIDGRIDLASEQLDMRAVVRPKDMSLFSLRSPLHVQGAFTSPSVVVEKGPLLRKAAIAAALGAVAGPAALIPFVDLGDQTLDDSCAATKASKGSASASSVQDGTSQPRSKTPAARSR
jgi:AsmA family protein